MKPREDIDRQFDQLQDALETEQPSMRFTKNVMDAIDGLHVAPPVKLYVNPWIVKGIPALFIVTILILTAYIFTTADKVSYTSSTGYLSTVNSKGLTFMLFINVLLLLVFIERLLNGKSRLNSLSTGDGKVQH